ncbi:hypothetical protein D3C80_121590 [compost metagenome]
MTDRINIAAQLAQPVLVSTFREYVKKSKYSGYQLRKLFKLSVEEMAELLYLESAESDIQMPHLQHLFNLYNLMPELIPEVSSYEVDSILVESLTMRIPDNRPVRGGDAKQLRTIHQLSADQARSYYRMSPNSYASMTGKGALASLLNPTIAIMTRVWAANPLYVPKERDWTFDEISKIVPDTPRNSGIALGKQQSSATRWGHDVNMTPVVKACASLMVRTVVDDSYGAWLEYVIEEAKSRGVENVFSKGHWNKGEIKTLHATQVDKLKKGIKK